MILAIDPGTTHSGWCLAEPHNMIRPLRRFGKDANERVLEVIAEESVGIEWTTLVLELFESRGKGWFGSDCIQTVLWTGRFAEAAISRGYKVEYLHRRDVKIAVTGSAGSNDAAVRGALVDLYGGKMRAIGLKKTPGPLYGVSKDMWAAFAVAVTWAHRRGDVAGASRVQ